MGELTKTNNMGKQSPGPIYNYKDEVKYKKVNTKNFKVNSLLVGNLELLREVKVINLNMISMKMQHS